MSVKTFRRGRRVTRVLVEKKPTIGQEALNMAKRNKRNIKEISEVVLGIAVSKVGAFNATPNVTYVSDVPGNGTSCKLRSIRVKGTIKRDVASLLIDDWRVDLVLDRLPGGSALTPLLYLGSATPTMGAFKNILMKKRYRILRTEFGHFDEGGNGKSAHEIDWYVKLNLIAKSKAIDDFTQGNIIANAIYLVYWTTAVANQPISALQTIVYIDSEGN